MEKWGGKEWQGEGKGVRLGESWNLGEGQGRKEKRRGLTKCHGVCGITCEGYETGTAVPWFGGPIRETVVPNCCTLGDTQEGLLERGTKVFATLIESL